jgi:hypothetical protein
MRRGWVFLCACLLAVALAQPALRADDGLPIAFAEADECLGVVPHLPTDFGRGTITANIVVALDGVSRADAQKIVKKAATAYGPGPVAQLTPDVKINVIAYHDVTGKLRSTDAGGFIVEEHPTGTDLMSELIRYYHKHYPKLNRHHVHLLTTKDLQLPPYGSAVAGIANCIGGVGTRYAYAITEVGLIDEVDVNGLAAYRDADAKNMAHEMGHVFGAHHHYANCAEDFAAGLAAQSVDVCSLMFPSLDFLSLHFGIVEVAAIRGYVEAHIAKTNVLPERVL